MTRYSKEKFYQMQKCIKKNCRNRSEKNFCFVGLRKLLIIYRVAVSLPLLFVEFIAMVHKYIIA